MTVRSFQGFLVAAVARIRHFGETSPRFSLFLAGAVMPLAYPPYFLTPIFYLSTACAFWVALNLLDSKKISFMAGLGWCFGFGQFLTGLAWIGEAFLVEAELFLWALPFAVTGLPAGLALFHAVAFAVWAALYRRLAWSKPAALIGLALALSAAAFLRGHILTGLPWNLPAMGWAGWLYLAQPVALIGPYGLSFLALLSAGLLALATRRAVLWALALPVAALLYSVFALHVLPRAVPAEDADAPLKLAIVQPNLAQKEKWDPALRDAHIDKTFSLTGLALQLAPDTQLVVWPETAIPALIDEGPGFAELLKARLPQDRPPPYVLTGAIRREAGLDGYAYFNSAQLWSGRGYLLARSDKHHLVPFGEYLPFQGFLEAIGLEQLTRLRGGYRAGPPQPVLTASRLPVLAPLICYEAMFPHLSRFTADRPRPAGLVNLTNDGWFGTGFGPHQHLAQNRLRAIEQGLPLIRAANTGISAAYDARGRLVDRLALGEKGVLTLDLPPALPPGPYARFGESLFWLLWAAGVIFMWAIERRRV